MRRLILIAALALLALPVVAQAQVEPYSSSTTEVAPANPIINLNASGLTVTFSASNVTAACTWNFGDGNTSTENSPTHTYAAAGTYLVVATCGAIVIERTVTVAESLPYTGFGFVPFGVGIAVLLLLALVALGVSRRLRENR